MGRTLDYRRVTDSTYQIFYGKEYSLKSLSKTYGCNAPAVTQPTFVLENDSHLFLSRGCGSACRVGMLLPLDKKSKAKEIIYWLEANMKSGLIAHIGIDETVFVEVLDINANKSYRLGNVNCNYGISVDCVAKVDIIDRTVTVYWDKDLKRAPDSKSF